MRDYEALTESIPQDLETVIAKSLAKFPENRYQSAKEMREDLQGVLGGENVSAFVQKNGNYAVSDSAIPPTEKAMMDSRRNSQTETETVLRPAIIFGQDKRSKSSNIWLLATTALFLVSAIGSGFFVISNQIGQNISNKNEVAKSNSKTSTTNSSIEVATTDSKTNLKDQIVENSNDTVKIPNPTITPDKAQLQKVINNYLAAVVKTLGNKKHLEHKDSREVLFGDLDNDGDEVVAAGFVIGFKSGGNWNVVTLAVFRNEDGKFKGVTDEQIGGFFNGYANLKYIKNGKIYVENNELVSYKLNGNKVVKGK